MSDEGFFKRQDLVACVVDRAGLPRGKATIVVDTILEAIVDTLKSGREIRLVGFGSFVIAAREARTGHDPRTGQAMDIPAARSVRFRPGKGLREAIAMTENGGAGG